MPSHLRIASLVSCATEMLYALGLGDSVVAVSHECDYPADVARKPRVTRTRVDASASSRQIDTQVRQLGATGAPLYELDVGILAALHPGLIVTQAQCDVCALPYADVEQAVSGSRELSNARIVSLNPRSLDDVLEELVQLGAAAGRREEALQIVAQLKRRVAAVCTCVAAADSKNRPRTCIIEWIEPLMLSGNWVPELVELAGGGCDLVEASRHSRYADWNDLVGYDPEVIVVVPCGFQLERTLNESQRLKKLPGWSTISAVRGGRVYAVDGSAYFNRPGPRLVDSLELLAHFLHPTHCPPPATAPEGAAWQR